MSRRPIVAAGRAIPTTSTAAAHQLMKRAFGMSWNMSALQVGSPGKCRQITRVRYELYDNSGVVSRYIEVKSMSGRWNNTYGVLSRPQFEKAREIGDRFWLYVVERAESDDFQVHRVQGVALKANRFMFDDGWRAMAEANRAVRRGRIIVSMSERKKAELRWAGKYNSDGTLKEVPRLDLPFQVIETINEVERHARRKLSCESDIV